MAGSLFIIAFLAGNIISITSATDVFTKTRLGNIIGIESQRNFVNGGQVRVDIFLGIPFAEAPLGKLRFKKPRPHRGWLGDLSATKRSPMCPQLRLEPPGHTNQGSMPPVMPPDPSKKSGEGNAPAGGNMGKLFGGDNSQSGGDISELFGGGSVPQRGDISQKVGGGNAPPGGGFSQIIGGGNAPPGPSSIGAPVWPGLPTSVSKNTTGSDIPKAPSILQTPTLTGPESEDCLYLNIFVPVQKGNTSLPVVVWIHEGEFVVGSSFNSLFDPASLAANTLSVVVTMSYRLNVFGFFVLDDGDYPGNLGLWDQIEAMKWVRNNIDSFGGDPGRVTIAGHSAGGMSVSMHVANPHTKGLFQQAISLSGVVSRLSTSKKLVKIASEALLMNTNCEQGKNQECLEKLSTSEIMTRVNYIYMADFSFGPVVDGVFLQSEPKDAFYSGNYNRVPYLIGMNSDEGLLNAMNVLMEHGEDITSQHLTTAAMDDVIKHLKSSRDIKEFTPAKTQALNTFFHRHYKLNGEDDIFVTLRKVIDTYSEVNFVEPILTYADLLSQKSENVYLYYFNHTLQYVKGNYEPSLGIPIGAGHLEPLPILLGQEKIPLTDSERDMSFQFMESLKDYLHQGVPTLRTIKGEKVSFPRYKNIDASYLDIGDAEEIFTVRNSLFKETRTFWSTIMPAVLEDLQGSCVNQPKSMSKISQKKFQMLTPSPPDVISTPLGDLRGLVGTHSTKGLPYMAFLGVPYSAPPIGARRWLPPEPATRWRQQREALIFGPSCPQNGGGNQNEDCLYLNIWLPYQLQMTDLPRHPVVVYLHGGQFQTGSGSDPSLLDLAFELNAVVVSANFRLGALGFLSTASEEDPGNNAHRDILMALQWINDNIYAFGGNPIQVTLFGEDSGAALASQLLLSRKSRGLFQNVIAIGGSSSSPWAFDTNPENTAKNFALALGCPTSNIKDMMSCIQGQDTEALLTPFTMNKNGENFVSPLGLYPWRPTMDEYINWRNPPGSLPGALLTGSTQYEGAHLLEGMRQIRIKSMEEFQEILRGFLSKEVSTSKALYENIRLEYISNVDSPNGSDILEALTEIFTDWAYREPQDSDLGMVTRLGGSGYVYKFNYKPSRRKESFSPTHGDDLRMIFGKHLDKKGNYDNMDVVISSMLMGGLKSFVASGHPTDDPDFHWEVYDPVLKPYMKIDADGQMVFETDGNPARLHLWSKMVDWFTSLQQAGCGLDSPPIGNTDEPTKRLENYGPSTNADISNTTNVNGQKAIFNIDIFTSQVVSLTLGGVCVVLIFIVVALATANCSMKRHLFPSGANPRFPSTSIENGHVTSEDGQKCQTKL